MLAPSSFSESNPLRWASIRVFKVISRRRRRPIDRWCCFSFPNRTHFIGLRFGPIKEQTPFRFRLTAKTALCWLLLPFPNRTRSAGLRFGCLRSSAAAGGARLTDGVVFPFQIEPISLGFDLAPSRSKHRSVSASRRKLHYVGSFFLFRIEPAPLGFDLLFLQQGGQAQFVPARLRIFFRFPIFTF